MAIQDAPPHPPLQPFVQMSLGLVTGNSICGAFMRVTRQRSFMFTKPTP
jgi:hypothetical protein